MPADYYLSANKQGSQAVNNGHMTDHTFIRIESPGVNCAVVREEDDGWKILLLKRAPTETYGGSWGFVTGRKRGTETVAQIVQREILEETGLTPTRVFATEHVVQFYEPEVDAIWVLPLIVATVNPDAEVVLNHENTEFAWLPVLRARNRVSWKNLMRSIDLIYDELELFPARNWVEIKP